MSQPILSALISEFQSTYDAKAMDQVWANQSKIFWAFWNERVLAESTDVIPDAECDEIIKILDRNGKGNTKDSEAVAKAMVPQGAWRRMLNEFHTNKALGALLNKIFVETDPAKKGSLIDELYKVNEGQRNNLTGPSGNAVGAYLAACDPMSNISIISLKDRRAVIEFLGLSVPFDWDKASIGTRMVSTNKIIVEGFKNAGLAGSARTLSRFCYFPPMKALWKGEHLIKSADMNVSVTIPMADDGDDEDVADKDAVRESMQIQAQIAKIGASMNCKIWLPKADRSRVLKAWDPAPGELLDVLPLGFDPSTTSTIEQIDVIWIRNRSIVRAFEVEHTTSVYSGLLRMADLVALQPNINIKLHIVAPIARQEKVCREITRPVFSFLGGRPLSELCTYLSYDSIKEIAESKFLAHLKDEVIEEYVQSAGGEGL